MFAPMIGSWILWGGLSAAIAAPAALVPDALDRDVPRRRYDILALHLDLALDVPNRGIGGVAKYTVAQLSKGEFRLDQVALNIESVTVDGESAVHRTPGNSLVIEMPDRLVRGGQAEVEMLVGVRFGVGGLVLLASAQQLEKLSENGPLPAGFPMREHSPGVGDLQGSL